VRHFLQHQNGRDSKNLNKSHNLRANEPIREDKIT
jgi:hypothetical protein